MRRMLRTVLLKSLFILALLFAQQGAVTHSIAHVMAEQSQDQSVPHHGHCDLCALYAQVGSAIGSSIIHLDFSSNFEETHLSFSDSFSFLAFAAFAARAPPYSA
jgi:hypothetical protein